MQQLKKKQVNVCFLISYSPYSWFGLNLRHMVMPHMYCEMQNKLSNTRGSPLGSIGEIISSRCPIKQFLIEGVHIWQIDFLRCVD